MLSNTTQHILDYLARITSLALNAGEGGFDAASKVFVRNTESDFALFARLG